MKRLAPSILAAFASLSAAAACINARLPEVYADDDLGLEIVSHTLAAPEPVHGEIVLDLTLRNRLDRERRIELSPHVSNSALVLRTIALAPKEGVRARVPVPLVVESRAFSSSSFTIDDPARPSEKKAFPIHRITGLPDGYGRYGAGPGHGQKREILVSSAFSAECVLRDVPGLAADPGSSHRASHYEDSDVVRLVAEPSDWPDDWRAYSTFDAVMVDPALMDFFPDSVKRALEDYSAMGGAVLKLAPASDGGVAPGDRAEANRRIDDAFMRLRVTSLAESVDLVDAPAGIGLAIPGGVPQSLVLFFLAALVFVAMPVAARMCVKRGRRLLMLLVLPALAAVCALGVYLASIAAYGFTPSVARRAVTFLDADAHRAVTRGRIAVFSPVSLAGGVRFPLDASFARVSAPQSGRNARPPTMRADGEQVLEGSDWIPPLVATYFTCDRAENRPERLEVSVEPDGAVRVANLLGARVVEGSVRVGGRPFFFNGLEAGASVRIPSTAEDATAPRFDSAEDAHADVLGDFARWQWDWTAVGKPALASPPEGAFVARLAGAPFMPSPLAGRRSEESAESIVVGRFTETGGAR